MAEALGHQLPAFPVVLAHAVLDGDDGVLIDKAFPHIDHLLAGHDGAALGQVVALILFVVPVGNCAVDRDLEVLAGLVAGLFHGCNKSLECVLVGIEVGSIAALIANAGCRNDLLQSMENLCAHTQCFLPALCADGHDHELLDIDVRAGSVCAAIENVHHGNGQGLGVHAADVVIKALAGGFGCCACAGERYAEDGVCAEARLVGGSVYLDEHLVDAGLIEDVQADHGLGDLAVYVLNCLADALAAVTALVAVAQLACFVHAGGCAGGNGCTADGAVIEGDLDLDGRVAARVKDLSCHNVNDLKILLHDSQSPFI